MEEVLYFHMDKMYGIKALEHIALLFKPENEPKRLANVSENTLRAH